MLAWVKTSTVRPRAAKLLREPHFRRVAEVMPDVDARVGVLARGVGDAGEERVTPASELLVVEKVGPRPGITARAAQRVGIVPISDNIAR